MGKGGPARTTAHIISTSRSIVKMVSSETLLEVQRLLIPVAREKQLAVHAWRLATLIASEGYTSTMAAVTVSAYLRKEAVFAAGEASDSHPLDCRVAARDLDTIFLATQSTVQQWRVQLPTPLVAYNFEDKNAFPAPLDAQCSGVVHVGNPRDIISQIRFQHSSASEGGNSARTNIYNHTSS